jgi:DNA-binding MarR family transcriptional regulator
MYITDMNEHVLARGTSEDDRPVRRVVGTGQAVEGKLEMSLQPYGLSVAKISALEALILAGEAIPLGVLGDRLGCVKSNVTQLMDRLEADRLVRRVPDAGDRRSILAEITPAGRERYAAGRRAILAAEERILANLTAAERQELSLLLKRLDV